MKSLKKAKFRSNPLTSTDSSWQGNTTGCDSPVRDIIFKAKANNLTALFLRNVKGKDRALVFISVTLIPPLHNVCNAIKVQVSCYQTTRWFSVYNTFVYMYP